MSEKPNLVALDRAEVSAVLAALRLLQATGQVPQAINAILTDEGTHDPLSIDQIDALCERINCAPEVSR